MKHIRNILIPALFILFTFVMFSCDPDTDPDDTTNAREKFTGSWTCVEESQLTYTVVISPSSTNENEILLANFHTLGQNEQAVGLIAGYSVTIAEQSMCSGDYLVKGNGLMSANEKNISFQYVVTSGVSTDTVNATYTQQ
jgi:hypothetical protein